MSSHCKDNDFCVEEMMNELNLPPSYFQSKYGDAPKPTVKQKLALTINGYAFYKWIKTPTDLDYLPVYIARCRIHGLFLDSPHGYSGHFVCYTCYVEHVQKCHV